MKNKLVSSFLSALLLVITQSLNAQSCETIKDADGNVYNTVKIGNQCWMTENMRSKTDRYGEKISNAKKANVESPSRYNPGDSKSNVEQYGYLYNLSAAMKVCPAGWHLPDRAEWTYLDKELNGRQVFNSKAAGRFTDNYTDFNTASFFWSSTAYSCWRQDATNSKITESKSSSISDGFSVRCVHDGVGIVKTTGSRSDYKITSTTAEISGEVETDGNSTITAVGVCWSKYQNPTIADEITKENTNRTQFSCHLSGLKPGTKYYARTYVTNAYGTTYGEQVSFTTLDIPKVNTKDVSGVELKSAMCGGSVIEDGGAKVTARGVCWSTSHNPTVTDNHTTDGTGKGSFSSTLTGLLPSTTYYVRAYATNSVGTSYGKELSFTTLTPFICGKSTVKDHEGNVYNTVQIGEQCWTKENMRCKTSPSTGTNILDYPEHSFSESGKKAYYVHGDPSTLQKGYGLLYNWNAAMDTFNTAYRETSSYVYDYEEDDDSPYVVDVNFSGNRRGICPEGWHVPNDAEWTMLTAYIGTHSENTCDNNSSKIAKALASKEGWKSDDEPCTIGNNPSSNNATGFSAVPAGIYRGYGYGLFGSNAYFWSATQDKTILSVFKQSVSIEACSRDLCDNLASGSYNMKYCGKSVRCLRDQSGIAGAPATGGSGSTGNAVGESCGTVTDYEGNSYNTVKIGNQCWMRENLKTTHYSDGTSIALGSTTSSTKAYRYYPDNNSSNVATYGYLYNWPAVMKGETGTDQGVQGICPTGWHVPSYAEWDLMQAVVGMERTVLCSDNPCYIAKALASKDGWESYNELEPCAIGNNPSSNNATGFSAVPACYYPSDGYYDFGSIAYFWSATQYDSSNAYYRQLYVETADMASYYEDKYNGYSVRCLRD